MTLPSYSIPRIFKLRDKIKRSIPLEYFGYAHTGTSFDDLVNHISSALPKVDRAIVWDSLRTYVDVPLLQTEIDELSLRLAGNLERLQNGTVVPPWSTLVEDEWVPVKVVAVHKFRIKPVKETPDMTEDEVQHRSRAHVDVVLRALGGYPAGHIFEVGKPEGFWRWNRVHIGFSAYANDPTNIYRVQKPAFPMADVAELAGMEFFIWLTHELCTSDINFDKIACSGAMRKRNQELLHKRQRIGFTCPFNFPLPQCQCYKCPKGQDACEVACHDKTYFKQVCAKCKRRAYHDPERPGQVCVDCLSRFIRRGHR